MFAAVFEPEPAPVARPSARLHRCDRQALAIPSEGADAVTIEGAFASEIFPARGALAAVAGQRRLAWRWQSASMVWPLIQST
jgi:hypothetical protein